MNIDLGAGSQTPLPHNISSPGRELGSWPRGLKLQFCFFSAPGHVCLAHGGPEVGGLRGRTAELEARGWHRGHTLEPADRLLSARGGLVLIPTIHPERSGSQSAVMSDTASGPCNCSHSGQSEACDPIIQMTTPRSLRLNVWPEAAQEVAKQGDGARPPRAGPATASCAKQSSSSETSGDGGYACTR